MIGRRRAVRPSDPRYPLSAVKVLTTATRGTEPRVIDREGVWRWTADGWELVEGFT